MSEEAKTPDQLFTEWLQANNFVALALAIAPLGDAVRVENFTPQNWRVAVSVVEAGDSVTTGSNNVLIGHMTAIMLIAKQVDSAFVENGKNPLFGVPFEVE